MDGYAVIEFSTSDPTEVAVIPSIWFTDDEKDSCFWPSFSSQKEMDDAIMEKLQPKPEEWTKCSVRCLYETDSYENAWERLIESTSGVTEENNDCSLIQENSRKRKWDSPQQNSDSEPEEGVAAEGDQPLSSNFQTQVLSLLEKIKAQNDEIIRLLKAQTQLPHPVDRPSLPVDLPMKSESDVHKLEHYLSLDRNSIPLVQYLSGLGGTSLLKCTHRIMQTLMTDHLASRYSYMGVRPGKPAFSTLKMNSIVIKAVRHSFKSASESDVEEILKRWLKYAKERILLREKRFNNRSQT